MSENHLLKKFESILRALPIPYVSVERAIGMLRDIDEAARVEARAELASELLSRSTKELEAMAVRGPNNAEPRQ